MNLQCSWTLMPKLSTTPWDCYTSSIGSEFRYSHSTAIPQLCASSPSWWLQYQNQVCSETSGRRALIQAWWGWKPAASMCWVNDERAFKGKSLQALWTVYQDCFHVVKVTLRRVLYSRLGVWGMQGPKAKKHRTKSSRNKHSHAIFTLLLPTFIHP